MHQIFFFKLHISWSFKLILLYSIKFWVNFVDQQYLWLKCLTIKNIPFTVISVTLIFLFYLFITYIYGNAKFQCITFYFMTNNEQIFQSSVGILRIYYCLALKNVWLLVCEINNDIWLKKKKLKKIRNFKLKFWDLTHLKILY